MRPSRVLAVLLLALSACATAGLTPAGQAVLTSQSAPIDHGYPPGTCKSLGYIVGRGGGSFGGGWLSNDSLVEYAMNDLRNKAASLGANYIQHDSPQMGVAGSNGSTTTSTATVSGTAYACKEPTAPAPAASSTPSVTATTGASSTPSVTAAATTGAVPTGTR